MARAAGYSLLELLVALAIMGLIATVAVPMVVNAVERTTLTTDARTLATGLRAWRDTALDQQIEITVTPAGHRLNASHGDELALTSGTAAEIVGARTLVIGPSGGTHGTVRLSRGASSVRITVNAVTGRIAIEAAP